MLFSISPINECLYQKEIKKTLKEYDEFFNVNYKDNKLSVFIVPTQEIYHMIEGEEEDYVVANTLPYHGKVFIIAQNEIKDKYDRNMYLKLLKHELVHIYVSRYLKFKYFIPHWIHEGLAVFLSKQVDNRFCCKEIYSLFNKNAKNNICYSGGGIFIEYLVKEYNRENLLKFLNELKTIKSEKEINKCFLHVYGKSLKQILIEMCDESEFCEGKFSITSFKKSFEERVQEYKKEYGTFFNVDFSEVKIKVNCISNKEKFNEKYIKEKESKIFGVETSYVNLNKNVINAFPYNSRKYYIKKNYYLQTIKKAVGEIILYNFLNKNKSIPYWFINGFATYVSDNFIFKDLDDKNIEMLFNKNIPETKSRTLAGLFIKYLIENYKKEKFLKLVNLLKDIKSEDEVNDCFIKVYEKSLKEMVELSY